MSADMYIVLNVAKTFKPLKQGYRLADRTSPSRDQNFWHFWDGDFLPTFQAMELQSSNLDFLSWSQFSTSLPPREQDIYMPARNNLPWAKHANLFALQGLAILTGLKLYSLSGLG